MRKKGPETKKRLSAAIMCAVLMLSSVSPFSVVQAEQVSASASSETETAGAESGIMTASDLFKSGASEAAEAESSAAQTAQSAETPITEITGWNTDDIRITVTEQDGLLSEKNLEKLPSTLSAKTADGDVNVPVKGWQYDLDTRTNTTVEAKPILDERYKMAAGISLLTAVLVLRPAVKRGAPPVTPAKVRIRDLRVKLFSGAVKQDDGTWLWDDPAKTGDSKAGHQFAYRITYALSGEGEVPAGAVTFTVPKDTLKDRAGTYADTVQWSIPSREDIDAITDSAGNINSDELSQDVSYAYRESDDGKSYIIYNFREVEASDQGFIELSYATSKTTFNYADMQAMDPFTVSMHLDNDTADGDSKTAGPIVTKIDTNAAITRTVKMYPGSGKIKDWNSSWGDNVKPSDPSAYYYKVWTIASYINATQPYTFRIDDTLTSNLDNKMVILGYRYSGEQTFHKDNNGVTGQTIQGANSPRFDYVLMGIPLSVYDSSAYWMAKNSETATVTPEDKIDPATKKSSSNIWTWTKPVFHEPYGQFDGYKRGDGGYRTYELGTPWRSVWTLTNHSAPSLGFKASEFSRYDLEKFTGYDGADKTLTNYDGFDYASWMVGYPANFTYTGNNPLDPDSYYKQDVRYTLVDEGFYLANSELAVSEDSSAARTPGSGITETIDGKKTAIQLTADDFRIDSIEYSWDMDDARLDDEDLVFYSSGSVTYGSTETLDFYGKFGAGTDWVRFASYNLGTGAVTSDAAYVRSMDNKNIVMQDGQNLTAYKVETANHHYHTEVYTVPHITLKNSGAVMDLLKDSRTLVLVNNNQAAFAMKNGDGWKDILTVNHSDLDYACVTQRYSRMDKQEIAATNNTKRRYYTITWRLRMSETVTTDAAGHTSPIQQNGGTFYDLIPAGGEVQKKSVAVSSRGTPLPSSAYDVSSISNYKGTGRTMLVVNIKNPGAEYAVTFDTRHSWNSIKDYGRTIYNPAAYETGNDSIYHGFADNGGTKMMDGTDAKTLSKDADLMSGLAKGTGMSSEDVTAAKFLYAEDTDRIEGLISATSGLTKKVRAEKDSSYVTSTKTSINSDYSYEIRFMNSSDSRAKNIIFFDSLENFDPQTRTVKTEGSQWRGTLTGIDVNQFKLKGAAPVVYISTKNDFNPENKNERNLSDTSIWTKVTDGTDLSGARAVAIDVSKKPDGSEFSLASGDSCIAHLYMKSPAADSSTAAGYHYAYNNIYESCTLVDDETLRSEDTMANFDYTKIMLYISGKLSLHKTGSDKGGDISGITYTLRGTSDYGTDVAKSIQTDVYGVAVFDDIEKGTYMLQETKATPDWLLDTTEHTVKIDDKGHTIFDGADITGKQAELKDDPRVHTDIRFRKVDLISHNKRLAGASFRLSGKSDYGTDTLMTAESGTNGIVTFSDVEKGTYELKELAAPEGYITNGMYRSVKVTVRIDENGNFTLTGAGDVAGSVMFDKDSTGVYEYPNEPYHSFAFTKLSTYDKSPVEGAKFTLTGTSAYGSAVNMTASSEKTTGTVRFENLEPGTYTLKETEAPDGFALNDKSSAVTVRSDGTYSISNLTQDSNGVYQMFDKKLKDKVITIKKVWNDGAGRNSAHTDSSGNQDPSKLDISISTQIPETASRTFKVIYDANGGYFN